MHNQNIFYASNTQQDIFPHNTRSNFENHIPKEHLDYIPDDDLEVGIKSITFDNNLKTAQINKQEKEPHIIIFQRKEQKITLDDLYNFPNIQERIHFIKDANEKISFDKNRDYVASVKNISISRDRETFYLEGKQDKFTSFSIVFSEDISPSIPFRNGIMHNIFLNEQKIYSNRDFISLLNLVLDSLLYNSSQSSKFFIVENAVYLTNLGDLQIYIGSQIFDKFFNDDSLNPREFTSIQDLINYNKYRFVRGKKKPFDYIYKKFPFKNFIGTIFMLDNVKFVELKEGKIVDSVQNIGKLDVRSIKSNICDYSIQNVKYNKVMTYFDASNFKDDNVVKIDFINPIFHHTNKDFLRNAKFQIIDADTEKQPDFSSGAPTYVQTIVRKRKMKERKNIFLESTCQMSQKLFPSNTNMSFKTKLPEHFNLFGDWYLNLKKIIIPSKLNNIYKKLCWMYYIENGKFGGYVELEDGFYSNIETLLRKMEYNLAKKKIPVILYINEGKILITANTNAGSQIVVSPHLSIILGLNEEFKKFENDFSVQKTVVGKNIPNINLLLPRNIIVTCDLVEHTIFAAQQLKLLRLIANTKKAESTFLEYEFLQDEYVKMSVKDFETIQINILDVTGITVKTESKLPTYIEAELVKF